VSTLLQAASTYGAYQTSSAGKAERGIGPRRHREHLAVLVDQGAALEAGAIAASTATPLVDTSTIDPWVIEAPAVPSPDTA
jgi:hypothetical protein